MEREQNSGSQSDRIIVSNIKKESLIKNQDITESKKEKDAAEKEILELEIKDQRSKIQQKEEYPKKFLNIARSYLVFVGLVIIASGTSYHPFNFFSVSDRVILTLLGTSLASILIPIQLFAKYLFAQSKDENS